MVIKDLTITFEKGLNLYSVARFNQVASYHKARIWVEFEDRRVSARDGWSLLALKVDKGDQIKIIADGADEQEAIEELTTLVESDFRDMRILVE